MVGMWIFFFSFFFCIVGFSLSFLRPKNALYPNWVRSRRFLAQFFWKYQTSLCIKFKFYDKISGLLRWSHVIKKVNNSDQTWLSHNHIAFLFWMTWVIKIWYVEGRTINHCLTQNFGVGAAQNMMMLCGGREP